MAKLLHIVFFCLMTSNAFGQTDFITMSAHGPILTNKPIDKNYYHAEIKINVKTGAVFFREKTSKNFKPISKLNTDSSVLFMQSVRYQKLDSIVKNNSYQVEVNFKVEFIHHGEAMGLPDPTFTHILEFGYPIGGMPYLNELIRNYYKLKSKIKK